MDTHIHYLIRWALAAIALAVPIAWAQGGGHETFELRPDAHPSDIAKLHDPVTEFTRRLAAGKEKLAFDEQLGYLPAILKALDLPLSSQMLVFSKTSLQHKYINPQTPRAIQQRVGRLAQRSGQGLVGPAIRGGGVGCRGVGHLPIVAGAAGVRCHPGAVNGRRQWAPPAGAAARQVTAPANAASAGTPLRH